MLRGTGTRRRRELSSFCGRFKAALWAASPIFTSESAQESIIYLRIISDAAAAAAAAIILCRSPQCSCCAAVWMIFFFLQRHVKPIETELKPKICDISIGTSTHHAFARASADESDGAHTLPPDHMRFIIFKDNLALLDVAKWGDREGADAIHDGLQETSAAAAAATSKYNKNLPPPMLLDRCPVSADISRLLGEQAEAAASGLGVEVHSLATQFLTKSNSGVSMSHLAEASVYLGGVTRSVYLQCIGSKHSDIAADIPPQHPHFVCLGKRRQRQRSR